MTARMPTAAPYAVASFAAAFLLFLVQPMIAKAIIPNYGGSASVWTSTLLMSQLLLLAGSLYAQRVLRLRAVRGAVHAFVTAAIVLVTVLLPSRVLATRPPEFLTALHPEIAVPLMVLASVGPAMFLLGSQSPFLQRAWARNGGTSNPYPLYAASNAGSLLGLVAYPFLLEPLVGIRSQIALWNACAATAMVGCCAIALRGAPRFEEANPHPIGTPALTRWEWSLRAFLAVIIMMSGGQILTSDVMAMPIVWILPLGAFLVGYMTAFSAEPDTDFTRSLRIPQSGLVILSITIGGTLAITSSMVALIGILAIGLVTHGLIRPAYETRPAEDGIGSFYLALAIGGAAGGIVSAIIAPLLLDWRWEAPAALLASALLIRPTVRTEEVAPFARRIVLVVLVAFAAIAGVVSIIMQAKGITIPLMLVGVVLSCIALATQTTHRRTLFAAAIGWTMLSTGIAAQVMHSIQGRSHRSYYGIIAVEEAKTKQGSERILTHGSTIHGKQLIAAPRIPTTYYTSSSGIGDALRNLSARDGPPDVVVAGLGAGTLACLAPAGTDITFLEIDPEIVDIARGDFTFLEECAPNARILVGDARMLAADMTRRYDAVVLDAFASDSIPMHLLTREGLDRFAANLNPGGWLLVHASNRYLDITSPVSAWAARRGYSAMVLEDSQGGGPDGTGSVWMAVRPGGWKSTENGWNADPRWSRALPGRLWTDDRSSILDIIREPKR